MFIGLVGKPSAGKSTFFKAATLMNVETANYPFTTIRPNSGVSFVRIECVDRDFRKQCNPREGYCREGMRYIPVQLLDVAGLVPGAHEGKGMGNQFLSDLNQADVLIHIVDISGGLNDKGEPVAAGSYDPANDIKFLEYELDMWYYQIFEKVWRRFSYTINQTREDAIKAIAKQFSGLRVTEDIVKAVLKKFELMEKPILTWTDADLKNITKEFRKETKPIIIAANKIDVPGAGENYERVKKQFPEYRIVPCSAESELALKEADKHGLIEYLPGNKDFRVMDESRLSDSQKKALDFIKKNILGKHGSTGVQGVLNTAVFDLLGYIAIYPAGDKLEDSKGNVLPDCFLLPPGTTALGFAYHLHTDLGNNFIRAVDIKTKQSVKKDHPLKHRDMIEIIHSK
ncbi:TPA: redox-regulated ATPase YchF [Candidatus Woesearchaeota archaeon]|nr:Translation-associated GTPase [archaeon GW2011_AR15]MBS3103404.1 redox-regulated ATPase YchF [Candidatus Woesearchaeota archaeon]HIH41521.1 redox-regulated ATPase YchF [Candidatus Woesearchaeota archaeon]